MTASIPGLVINNRGDSCIGKLPACIQPVVHEIFNIFLFTIGFILPCLWLLHWPISTIWIALYEFPAHHYLATNSVSLSLFLLFIICFAIVFASIKNKTREIYFLFTIQSSLLLASLSRPDYSHLTQSYFLFYVLAIIIINQLNKKERTNYLYQYISITALFIIV